MKGLFESSIFQKISRMADFFLASLLWLVTSLPVITAVPATIAMYYATVKIVRYKTPGSTVKSFFHSFKENLKQGVLLSLLYILAAVVLYTFVDVAKGVGLETLYSRIYLVLTVVYTLLLTAITLCLIPIISRFHISTLSALKLSVRFLAGGSLPLIPYVIALAGVIALCYVVPPLILVVPAGYCYSLSNYMEQLLNAYMEENVCEEANAPDWLQSEAQES